MLGARSFTALCLLGASVSGLSASCYYNDAPDYPASADGGVGGVGGAGGAAVGGAGGAGAGPALPTGLRAKVVSTRFVTADVMLASLEMQVSGEPFAELLGRDIAGYDRFSAQTDNYTDPTTGEPGADLLGFSLAIESYEYSKQSMNTLSFEAGAGLSLQYGPLLNPGGVTGDAAYGLLLSRLQYLARASRATGAKVGKDFVTVPPPPGDPQNPYGWAGFWPVFAELRSFDPAIVPKEGADQQCSLAGATDEPAPPGTVPLFVGDYECDSSTLNLPDREAQVEKVLAPDALGLSAWKQALWAINYWAAMHDVDQRPIVVVPEVVLDQVGEPDNQVIGQWESPIDPDKLLFGKDGTFFGGVSLEGWQGLVMMEEIDNKSSFLLGALTTTDGAALGGVPSPSIAAAVDYDYQSELRWWPAAVDVVEEQMAKTPEQARRDFPRPTSLTIKEGQSRLRDLAALAGGFGEVFTMTDAHNPEIGGTQQYRAAFDGAPFAADNGAPDGEDSLHDRSLGIVKMALVNLDRLHFDEAHQVLVDSASASSGGAVTRGTTVSTADAALAILGMRTALRALDGTLTLYTNDTPDTHGVPSALDLTSIAGATYDTTLVERVRRLITREADFLADRLLDEHGLAATGYDLGAGAALQGAPTLEAQAAAIRGLLEAHLATSDERYRQRAREAFAALERHFWMSDVRLYRTTAGESMTMVYTPRQFALIQGALRQYYKLVASRPGRADEAEVVLERVLYLMKIVVNGWNDVNRDGVVQKEECLSGRLQMAERALTGELSVAADEGDRDHDCVPDIAAARLPAALAAELVIERE